MKKIKKQISTLIEDIEDLLLNGKDDIQDEDIEKFGQELAKVITLNLKREDREPTLRMSAIGKPCERQLWYEINNPEEKEPFQAEHYMKFMFGHILEELLLFLTEQAGHSVEGRQDQQDIQGIKGHRDAVVDGVVVDVKSASSFSFKKFKEGRLKEDDPFGYITQIQSYLYAGQDDPVVTEKDKAAFFVIDKTLGHLCLDVHEKDGKNYDEVFQQKKDLVEGDVPKRGYEPVPYGQGGNMALSTACSYCPFKHICYPEARTFLYSHKPVHLVHVEKEPRVAEVLKDGTIVDPKDK